jgi:hypothetical protein
MRRPLREPPLKALAAPAPPAPPPPPARPARRPWSRCCRSTTSASWFRRRCSTPATLAWSRRACPRPSCRWVGGGAGAGCGAGEGRACRRLGRGARPCLTSCTRLLHIIVRIALAAGCTNSNRRGCNSRRCCCRCYPPPLLLLQAVSSAHPALQPLLYSNVVLAGGSARCPGFLERVVSELRPLVPEEYEVGPRPPVPS